MTTTSLDKLDLYKLHKDEYATPKKPVLIEMSAARYLTILGQGKPGGEAFQAKVGALYGMAYTIKFQSKSADRDFVVCKLEGLWGLDDQPAPDFGKLPPDEWKWKMMIRMPDFVEDSMLDEARAQLRAKGKEGDFDEVRLETIDEGQCVQMLHVGPYEQAQTTIDQMNALPDDQGLEAHMWYHEVYLSDPRRVPAEKLRTILRQPVTARS